MYNFTLLFFILLSTSVFAEENPEYECVGGGVLIKYSEGGKCGINSHAGFTCENESYEICNPYLFGVRPDGKPVCFENALTDTCLSNITTGEDTVFDLVFNRSGSYANFLREKADLKRICDGDASINETEAAVSEVCERLNSQVTRNEERKLRGYGPPAGTGFQPLENGPNRQERARIREEVRDTELAVGQISEQNQTHDITIPATYFKRENGTIDRAAHRKFLDLYLRFNNHEDLKGSQKAMQRALAFFARNKDDIPSSCGGDLAEATSPNDGKTYPAVKKIENQRYVVFVDYTIPAPKDRFFILDLETGEVEKSSAAHGYGSNRPGCPEEHQIGHKCRIPVNVGNEPDSGKTSRGFFMLQDGYRSGQKTFKGGSPASRGHNALHMRGLNGGVNDNALARSVVFHRASYYAQEWSSSAGCPAFRPSLFESFKEKLPGSMLYIHTIDDEKRDQPDC